MTRVAASFVDICNTLHQFRVGGKTIGRPLLPFVDKPIVIRGIPINPCHQTQPLLPAQCNSPATRSLTKYLNEFAAPRSEFQWLGSPCITLDIRARHKLVLDNGLKGAVESVACNRFCMARSTTWSRRQTAAKVQASCRFEPAVTPDTMSVENGLDVAQEADCTITPRRRDRFGCVTLQSERMRRAGRGLAPRLVATHAATVLSRLKADERAHAPQFHVVFVQQLEVYGCVGRNAKMGTAVTLDGHGSYDPHRCPIVGICLLCIPVPAILIVVRPTQSVGYANEASLAAFDAVGTIRCLS